MANTTSKVDNLDICTAIVNINGVAAANIKAMNVWDKKLVVQQMDQSQYQYHKTIVH